MRRTLLQAIALIAAWIPSFFLWTMLAIVYGRMTPAAAASLSATTIATAAVLGVAIWRFCTATPWPRKLRAGFYVKHLAAAVIYAVTWIAGGYAIEGVVARKPVSWRA